MSGLSVEDFKNVLLDLYLAQRENAALHAQLMQHSTDVSGEQEEVSRDESGGRHP